MLITKNEFCNRGTPAKTDILTKYLQILLVQGDMHLFPKNLKEKPSSGFRSENTEAAVFSVEVRTETFAFYASVTKQFICERSKHLKKVFSLLFHLRPVSLP